MYSTDECKFLFALSQLPGLRMSKRSFIALGEEDIFYSEMSQKCTSSEKHKSLGKVIAMTLYRCIANQSQRILVYFAFLKFIAVRLKAILRNVSLNLINVHFHILNSIIQQTTKKERF